MKKRLLALFVYTFLFYSCKEIYTPNVDLINDALVVQGLITNQNRSYTINLSYARSFNDLNSILPVRNARVYITDNCLNVFDLTEYYPGRYRTDSLLFIAEFGVPYQLNIETEGGDVYQSDSQMILPPIQIDTLVGYFSTKEVLTWSKYGKPIKSSYPIIDAYIDVNGDASSSFPKIRFDVNLLVEYTYAVETMTGSPPTPNRDNYYCNKMLNPNTKVNLTINKYNKPGSNNIYNHNLCFFPKNKDRYGLLSQHEICRFVLLVKSYRLNDQAYDFYLKALEQVNSDNKIFDPISVQLPSNIRCTSNSDKIVMGFFEASSVSEANYGLYYENGVPVFKLVRPIKIDKQSCLKNAIPSFWIY